MILFFSILSSIFWAFLNHDTVNIPNNKAYSSKVATDWMSLAVRIVRSNAWLPPPTIRFYAYSGLILYESQVPAMEKYQSMFTYLSGKNIPMETGGYYPPAAANAAMAACFRTFHFDSLARKSIDSLFSTYQGIFLNEAGQEEMEISERFGKKVAEVILEWSKADGFFGPPPSYVPPVGPGLWEPTPPEYLPPNGMLQAGMRTFVKDVKSLSDPGPPPPYSIEPGSLFYKAAVDTKKAVSIITKEEIRFLESWEDNPPSTYNPLSRMFQLFVWLMGKKNPSLEEASVLYAKMGITFQDVIYSTHAAKYKYNLLRPVTYIHKVLGDTGWMFVGFNPQFPSYPSLKAAVIGSSGALMESVFGKHYSFIDSTLPAFGIMSYPSINDFVEKSSFIRFKAGLNYRFAIEAGLKQGRKVAELVNKLPFKKSN